MMQGTPPWGGLNARGVAILDLSKATVSRKRCKIGGKLVLITNRNFVYELSIGTEIGELE